MDERAVRRTGGRGELVHDRRGRGQGALEAGVVLGRRGEQDRAGHLLEVAARDRRVGVVGGDHLALLGQPQPTIDRARRLAEDGPVRRPAAAPERPASTVEERQLDAARAGRRDQRRLGLVEHPGRGQEARFLVRIGVAEHHLLAIAAGREPGAVGRIVEQRTEDRARPVERLARFRTAGRRRARGRLRRRLSRRHQAPLRRRIGPARGRRSRPSRTR